MSLENYIIICDGRIDVQASRTQLERIKAASNCATEFVKFNRGNITQTDAQPISDLQHEMMDLVSGTTTQRTKQQPKSADEMVDEMFALLDALEDKLESSQKAGRV